MILDETIKVSHVLLLWVAVVVLMAVSTVSLFSRCISNIQVREKCVFLFFSESCLGWGSLSWGMEKGGQSLSCLSPGRCCVPQSVLVDVLRSPSSSSGASVPGGRGTPPSLTNPHMDINNPTVPAVPQRVL